MADTERHHAIPLLRSEIHEALVAELEGADADRFSALSRLLAALLHFEFHQQLEELKAAYAPINPDRERIGEPPSVEEQDECGNRVQAGLSAVLSKGNYRELGKLELAHALSERSLLPIDVAIDFDVFDDFVLYARGETIRDGKVPKWHGIGKRRILVPTYDRVCLYLRFKAEDNLNKKQKKSAGVEHGRTVLKLFRNIPKADLEMLFPNTEPRMRPKDKLMLGVPALVGGVPVLIKLTPVLLAIAILIGVERGEVNSAALVAGLSGLIGLGLFLFRQWDKFKSRKVLFLKMLSENLYFRNIDNNEGVLTRLIDEAEEEEHKEAMLAYHFLREEPGLTEKQLDERVEAWLFDRFGVDVDFEVDDALGKLKRLELVEGDEEGYRVVPMERALQILDKRWDGLFPYNQGS